MKYNYLNLATSQCECNPTIDAEFGYGCTLCTYTESPSVSFKCNNCMSNFVENKTTFKCECDNTKLLNCATCTV